MACRDLELRCRGLGGKHVGGRLLEEWALRSILEALPAVFAAYDERDIARALLEMISLFRRISTEVADRLGLSYPADSHAAIEAWATAHLLCLSPLESRF